MTAIGSTGGTNAAKPATATTAARQPGVTARPGMAAPDDIHAMGRALDRARLPVARQGQQSGDARPLAARTKSERTVPPGIADARHAPVEGELRERELTIADRRSGRHGGGASDHDADVSAAPMLATTAQAPVQPVAIPDMPAPHVDPAVFAQLMTQLWLRERGKGAKEVRVSFGDDAWPATGARLVRNAAGTLDIQLHVADGGALYRDGTLDGLTGSLAERGLAIGSVQLADGAVG